MSKREFLTFSFVVMASLALAACEVSGTASPSPEPLLPTEKPKPIDVEPSKTVLEGIFAEYYQQVADFEQNDWERSRAVFGEILERELIKLADENPQDRILRDLVAYSETPYFKPEGLMSRWATLLEETGEYWADFDQYILPFTTGPRSAYQFELYRDVTPADQKGLAWEPTLPNGESVVVRYIIVGDPIFTSLANSLIQGEHPSARVLPGEQNTYVAYLNAMAENALDLVRYGADYAESVRPLAKDEIPQLAIESASGRKQASSVHERFIQPRLMVLTYTTLKDLSPGDLTGEIQTFIKNDSDSIFFHEAQHIWDIGQGTSIGDPRFEARGQLAGMIFSTSAEAPVGIVGDDLDELIAYLHHDSEYFRQSSEKILDAMIKVLQENPGEFPSLDIENIPAEIKGSQVALRYYVAYGLVELAASKKDKLHDLFQATYDAIDEELQAQPSTFLPERVTPLVV